MNWLKVVLVLSIALNILLIGKYLIVKPKAITKLKESNRRSVRAEIFKHLPVEKNEIIFTGDSHIELLVLPEMFENHLVKNRGISGNKTADLLIRLPEIINRHPSKIFIEIGINDIAYEVPTEIIMSNISMIINDIKVGSPQTKIFFISIMPTPVRSKPNGLNLNETVKDINKKIRDMHNITFIDVYTALEKDGTLNPEYDSADHHLNADGALLFCRIIKPFVI